MAGAFLIQRFYRTVRLDLVPTVQHRSRPLPLYHRQGWWDKACGLYSAAMALTLFGAIAYGSTATMRQKKTLAQLRQVATDRFGTGFDGKELSAMLASCDTSLQIEHRGGGHRKVLAFALNELATGAAVLVSWRNREKTVFHWMLAIGVEGRQDGEAFRPTALLALDPDAPEPYLCAYNGRLALNASENGRGSTLMPYLLNDGSQLPVALVEAISLREAV